MVSDELFQIPVISFGRTLVARSRRRNSRSKERLHRALHKYKLTFLTISFRPQSSVHLSLFYQVTKVTGIIFKNHFMCSGSALDTQVIKFKRSRKENVTHKPAIEFSVFISHVTNSQNERRFQTFARNIDNVNFRALYARLTACLVNYPMYIAWHDKKMTKTKNRNRNRNRSINKFKNLGFDR